MTEKGEGRGMLKLNAHSTGQVHMLSGIRNQSQMSGPLDRHSHRSLMLGAGAGLAARIDPAPLRNILAQLAGVLIIYYINFVAAEGANFPLGDVFGSLPLSLRF